MHFDGHVPMSHFGKPKIDTKDEVVDNSANATSSLSSVFDQLIIQRSFSLIKSQKQHLFHNESNQKFKCDRYLVSVIRCAAPNGSFPDHVDHCNDTNAWVVLLSLGRRARFTVRGPFDATKKVLELRSGDIIAFDPSRKAAIKHGVATIDPWKGVAVTESEGCSRWVDPAKYNGDSALSELN